MLGPDDFAINDFARSFPASSGRGAAERGTVGFAHAAFPSLAEQAFKLPACNCENAEE